MCLLNKTINILLRGYVITYYWCYPLDSTHDVCNGLFFVDYFQVI